MPSMEGQDCDRNNGGGRVHALVYGLAATVGGPNYPYEPPCGWCLYRHRAQLYRRLAAWVRLSGWCAAACAICIHIPFARQFRYSGFAPPGGWRGCGFRRLAYMNYLFLRCPLWRQEKLSWAGLRYAQAHASRHDTNQLVHKFPLYN